jgi:hypothetical protein
MNLKEGSDHVLCISVLFWPFLCGLGTIRRKLSQSDIRDGTCLMWSTCNNHSAWMFVKLSEGIFCLLVCFVFLSYLSSFTSCYKETALIRPDTRHLAILRHGDFHVGCLDWSEPTQCVMLKSDLEIPAAWRTHRAHRPDLNSCFETLAQKHVSCISSSCIDERYSSVKCTVTDCMAGVRFSARAENFFAGHRIHNNPFSHVIDTRGFCVQVKSNTTWRFIVGAADTAVCVLSRVCWCMRLVVWKTIIKLTMQMKTWCLTAINLRFSLPFWYLRGVGKRRINCRLAICEWKLF